jgi:haloalkane dehalogenase
MPEILTTAQGVPFLRTPDAHFSDLPGYGFAPHYLEFEGLRLHYIDEGPRDGPVAVLMHGMPTWSFLNRKIMARLIKAGYRCIAADHIGFGRSDKVIADDWYSIARHIAAHTLLIETLDLRDITLFCQDWGGPISLAQVARAPDRFAHLVIMNTWLHHEAYTYTRALRRWNAQWHPDGLFGANVPDRISLGWFMMVASGHMPARALYAMVEGQAPPVLALEHDAVRRAYDAPFEGLGYEGHAGPRRFPLSLPFDNPLGGNAEGQAKDFAALLGWQKPIHFIWGGADDVFTEAWGRDWASHYPQARFDLVPEAGHFLQETHGELIADLFLSQIR